MSVLLQGLVVALLVALCAVYSTWRLLSARLRLRLLDEAALALPGVGSAAWFAALRAAALSKFAAGCANCTPAPTSAASRNKHLVHLAVDDALLVAPLRVSGHHAAPEAHRAGIR